MGQTADVDVCNLALTTIGSGAEISSLTGDQSQEARACNRVYATARDKTLKSFPWPFAKAQASLALVTQFGDPNHPTNDYKFSYRYPSDCLQARKISSRWRTDARETRVTYEFMADQVGQLIVTDKTGAVLEYTSTLGQDPGRWTPDFIEAMAYYVGFMIAPRLTKGDPFKIRNECYQLFKNALSAARANAANEIQPDEDPPEALILSRY